MKSDRVASLHVVDYAEAPCRVPVKLALPVVSGPRGIFDFLGYTPFLRCG